jgi:hypothetical protein
MKKWVFMKIKLLIDKGDNKAGDIVDGITPSGNLTGSYYYFYSGSSLNSAYAGEYEIVKDEPIEETQLVEKSGSYTKNITSLIAELSQYVSEIKFK